MKESKAVRILNRIKRDLGGELKISKRNVPYLIVGDYSICYFGGDRFLRTWNTFIGERFMDFKTYPELIRFFQSELNF